MSKGRLGKGLGALLGEYVEPHAGGSDLKTVPIPSIVPNPMQPRRVFTDDELAELARSIAENGLLQPLVVRPAPDAADRYELIAGERRLRSVTSLGWTEVPVIVREASDDTLLVLALVENLQREQLNPIEEAEGFARLQADFGLSHAEIGDAVGRSRSAIANMVRLLGLPPSIRKLVEGGELSQGHARALLTLEDQTLAAELARKAVKEGWSVREMERKARPRRAKPRPESRAKGPVVRALESALQEHLGTRVEVTERKAGDGSIRIQYHGHEDFERLFELVTSRKISEVVE